MWLGGERNIGGRDMRSTSFWSEEFVEVRTLVNGCSASFSFHPLISDSGFLLLRSIRMHVTSGTQCGVPFVIRIFPPID